MSRHLDIAVSTSSSKLITIAFPSTTDPVSGELLRISRRHEPRCAAEEDRKEPELVPELDTARMNAASKAWAAPATQT